MKFTFFKLFLFFPILLFAQTEKKILFIGNSYTAANSLTTIISQIAEANGNTLTAQAYTPGGSTLMQHSSNATVNSLINSNDWDFIVLQEQSQMPSFSPGQVANDVYPYAESLCTSITSNAFCTKPVFFMTWGRENGDQQNCANYPPICTYEGMQERLTQSYTEMAENNEAMLAPIGIAWANIRADFPNIDLYVSDGSHPSYAGSYLAANVFYAVLFGENPENIYYPSQISSLDAQTIKEYANNAVASTTIDYSSGASALASYEIVGDSLFLYNESENATNITWTGITQNVLAFEDTLAINFGEFTGLYEIQLLASNDCSDDELLIQINNLNTVEHTSKFTLYPNPSSGNIKWDSQQKFKSLNIYSSMGSLVESIDVHSKRHLNLSHLSSGIYKLVFIDENHRKKSISWSKKN